MPDSMRHQKLLQFSLLRIFALIAICAGASFFIREVIRGFHGPTPSQAFTRFITEPIPPSVNNLQLVYRRHLKGQFVALYFEINPDDAARIFPIDDFWSEGQIAEAGWDQESTFQQLPGTRELDLAHCRFLRRSSEDSWREIVISGDCRTVYFVYYSDSDLRRLQVR